MNSEIILFCIIAGIAIGAVFCYFAMKIVYDKRNVGSILVVEDEDGDQFMLEITRSEKDNLKHYKLVQMNVIRIKPRD